jgi:hypothetical protein
MLRRLSTAASIRRVRVAVGDSERVFVSDGEIRMHPTAEMQGSTEHDPAAHAGLLDDDGRLALSVGPSRLRIAPSCLPARPAWDAPAASRVCSWLGRSGLRLTELLAVDAGRGWFELDGSACAGLEPGEDERSGGENGGGEAVLEVMVPRAGLVAGHERGQLVGRVDPVQGGEREQQDDCDEGGEYQLGPFRHVFLRQLRAKPIVSAAPAARQ